MIWRAVAFVSSVRASQVAPPLCGASVTLSILENSGLGAISGDPGTLLQHLTQTEIFLDATTYLLVAIAFNTHPDNNALLDIPVEFRFSDYRPVSGAQIPFHVQKFLNNSLLLDLQFSSATLNSGLSATIFQVQ